MRLFGGDRLRTVCPAKGSKNIQNRFGQDPLSFVCRTLQKVPDALEALGGALQARTSQCAIQVTGLRLGGEMGIGLLMWASRICILAATIAGCRNPTDPTVSFRRGMKFGIRKAGKLEFRPDDSLAV